MRVVVVLPRLCLLVLAALVLSAGQATAGHRGDDPLDHAFSPALVHLDGAEGPAQVELVVRNADVTDLDVSLHLPEATQEIWLEPLEPTTFRLPHLATARLPFHVHVSDKARAGVHDVDVVVAHDMGSRRVTLRVAVDAPQEVLEPPRLDVKVERHDVRVVVENGAELARAFEVRLENAEDWRSTVWVEHSRGAAAPVTFLLRENGTSATTFRVMAGWNAPDEHVARVVVLETGREVASQPVTLRRDPPVSATIEPSPMRVPVNGLATGRIHLHNPADGPRWVSIGFQWQAAPGSAGVVRPGGFAFDLPEMPILLAPGETRQLDVMVRETMGRPHENAVALRVNGGGNFSQASSWHLVALPPAPAEETATQRSIPASPALVAMAAALILRKRR